MDKRLFDNTKLLESREEMAYFNGFEFAIQRLRENEYYGHYAQSLADWLEKHLSQEVVSDKATDK